MFKSSAILSLAVAGALLVGCDDKKPDSTPPKVPAAPTTADAPKVATPDAPKVTVPDAPKVTVPDAPKVTTPDAPKLPDAPKPADAPKAPDASATPAAPDTAGLKDALAKLESDVNDKKWDDAKADMAKIAPMASSLTGDMKTKFEELSAKVTANGLGSGLLGK